MNSRIQAALQDKENEIKIDSCMFVSFKTTRIESLSNSDSKRERVLFELQRDSISRK